MATPKQGFRIMLQGGRDIATTGTEQRDWTIYKTIATARKALKLELLDTLEGSRIYPEGGLLRSMLLAQTRGAEPMDKVSVRLDYVTITLDHWIEPYPGGPNDDIGPVEGYKQRHMERNRKA